MVEGEPTRDVFAMDVARFGDYCTRDYTRKTVVQNYQRRFAVSYPNEELPAGRPLKTTPAYGIWKAQNGVFGHGYGMENLNYIAPAGEEPFEIPSFRRSNAHATIGEEVRAVRTAVGINEIHNFGKYELTGPNAQAFLERVMANAPPPPGKLRLTPMLSRRGKLIGDFTMACVEEGRYRLTASYAAQAFHMRWFQEHLPDGARIENVSDSQLGFQIAGPKARELLSRVTRADVSKEALPFLSLLQAEVGGVPALVQRVSYTGDLGYEIYVDQRHQIALYEALSAAGGDLGLRPFGMRAMMSLRLEKNFGAWLREYRPDFTAAETGLDRFIRFDGRDFIGRAAAEEERDAPPEMAACAFTVAADDADVVADEPIFDGDQVIGFCTSGGYAHYVEQSVALGMIPRAKAQAGARFEIEILGERRPATLIAEPLFDPKAERMRG
ncbi:MAG: glycine cleavage T C-terminal barrel domain-containing protein [Marivibrio sp.]|uniref:glycine cleavage T C-terminal barrel domain-containing protein n=1 Tax=Marivibrio sp. TaxID=2039719 RepID=UPI0032EEC039